MCEACGELTEKPDVDHVVPVGKTPGARKSEGATWDALITRLFCGPEGLQILCRDCHQQKTNPTKEIAS